MTVIERISFLAVVVSSDLKWEKGGRNSLRRAIEESA
jgi:hypothetical protein